MTAISDLLCNFQAPKIKSQDSGTAGTFAGVMSNFHPGGKDNCLFNQQNNKRLSKS